ncbi:N-acyl-phosphatidylethanolamine-hydrolyzing phospholipase D [Gracilariopsis chorda]|uniref:N-acyl-phosphatidylethanolamine-hydrolyzing phospholipase D n=1 Tax=Gracilariopsis chorda TaxID=448386 RepID=A0A2V3J2C4_9FLOR|nr:N-acyl-phosphatidylethanolamine-hydrolyzing phospholipase D [Gracilariopsis chorda]|eukprot:PXF48493.1 N-acyl-phosphatidylethanolamine-hydrolyzing phospholipase D [Gracilariopsis chorda]
MSTVPDDAPASVRSLRALLPRTPAASKRVRPDSAQRDAPPPSSHSRRGAMLTRGKTVLKKAVSSGGAAFGVRKSSSLNDGLRTTLLTGTVPQGAEPSIPSPLLTKKPIQTNNSSSANTDPDPDSLVLAHSALHNRTSNSFHHTIRPTIAHSEPPAVNMELKQPAMSPLTNPNNRSKPSEPSTAHSPLAQHTSTSSQSKTDRTETAKGDQSSPDQKPQSTHSQQPSFRHSFRKHSDRSESQRPDDGGQAYESRFARVSRTGFVERSVAAAVISAARQRGLPRRPKQPHGAPRPQHHLPHGGFCNPWDSALKENGLRTRGGSGSRTFFHKVAKDRRPPEEQLASMLLLAERPDFVAGHEALKKDKYALVSHWIGHSTFLIQTRGLTVLTDPVWSTRLGPLGPKRLVPPTCSIAELPQPIDVVLISNSSYDSFDKNAVQVLAPRVTKWLVPIGLRALLVANNVKENAIIELDWWEEHRFNNTLFVCTPAQHYSLRDDTLWCSWLVHAPHHRFFYCGGTGYRSIYHDVEDSDSYDYRQKYGGHSCPVFKEISRRYGSCDTAFLPIGGYKPRTHMSGVQGDAIDMLSIHKDLRARRSVAHRWGTFSSSEEGMLDAVRTLEHGLLSGPVAEHEFSYLRHGQLHIT